MWLDDVLALCLKRHHLHALSFKHPLHDDYKADRVIVRIKRMKFWKNDRLLNIYNNKVFAYVTLQEDY